MKSDGEDRVFTFEQAAGDQGDIRPLVPIVRLGNRIAAGGVFEAGLSGVSLYYELPAIRTTSLKASTIAPTSARP